MAILSKQGKILICICVSPNIKEFKPLKSKHDQEIFIMAIKNLRMPQRPLPK